MAHDEEIRHRQDIPVFVDDKFHQAKLVIFEADSERSYMDRVQDRKNLITGMSSLLQKVPLEKILEKNRTHFENAKDFFKVHAGNTPPNKKLSERISENAFEELLRRFPYLDRETLNKQSAFTMKLFIESIDDSSVTVSRAYANRIDSRFAMDHVLIREAREEKKSLRFLDDHETVPDDCFDQIMAQALEVFLRQNSEASIELSLAELDKLVATYVSGADMNPDTKERYYQCLIIERNKLWLWDLEKLIEKSAMQSDPPPFVAVGVYHLFGPDSLLQLLKNKGFTIKRIEK